MSKVVVIGGGPAGMFAAYFAAKNGHKVTLLEQNEKLGKKLYITGKGRCNITNASDMEDLFANVCSNEKFLYSAFYSYTNEQVVDFFENYGLRTKVERGNRVFPVSDHSSDVIATLSKALKDVGVEVKLYTKVAKLITEIYHDEDGQTVIAEKKTGVLKQLIKGVVLEDNTRILADAIVVKCDVTKDVNYADIPAVSAFIKGNVRSYNQFSVKCHRNGNLTIDKSVDTRQAKKRMTIYNKSREMKKMDNRKFMNEYNIPDAEFDNMCRFEINLNSKAQIRTSLGIADTRLMSVLTSTKNPIIDFLDDIVADTDSVIPLTDKQSYLTELVLRDCHNDIAEVEAKMRQLYSKGTNLSKVMKPYKVALTKKNKSEFTKTDLLQMLQ